MQYILVLITLGLLFLPFYDEFWSCSAKASEVETDNRGVSVLRGTMSHVRDGDTFEIKGIPVRISALDCSENSTSSRKKLPDLLCNSKASRLSASSPAQRAKIDLLATAQLRAKTLPE